MQSDVRAFLDVEAQLDSDDWSHGDDEDEVEADEDEGDEGEFRLDNQYVMHVC